MKIGLLLSSVTPQLLLGVITCGLLVAPALGESPTGEAWPSFEQVKQRWLQRIDQMRACVAKATSFEQIKACRPERNKRDVAFSKTNMIRSRRERRFPSLVIQNQSNSRQEVGEMVPIDRPRTR